MKESFHKRLNEAMNIRNMKQVDLVEKTGIGKSAINHYVSGKYEAKQKALYALAQALNVNESWLMGYDVSMEKIDAEEYIDNLYKIQTKKLPLLGTIAAGEPLFVDQHIEYYVEVGTNIRADFCLKVKGDSMINARIQDGDIVFIRKQDVVEEGQIAAVLIEDEATLKRVYKTNGDLVLMSENPAYKPMVYTPGDCKNIRILGRAIAFQSDIF